MQAKEHQLLRREAELSRLEKEIRKREIELRKNDRALAIRETVLIEKERRYKGKYNSSHFTYSGRLVAVTHVLNSSSILHWDMYESEVSNSVPTR